MTYVLIKNTIKRNSFIADKICVFAQSDVKKELYIPENQSVTFQTKNEIYNYTESYGLNLIGYKSDEKLIYNKINGYIEYHTKYGCIPDVYYTIEKEYNVVTENINLKNFINHLEMSVN